MAIPDPEKGLNPSPWMCPRLIQPQSTLIHHFGGGRPTYGHKRAIYGLLSHFGTLWRPRWPIDRVVGTSKFQITKPDALFVVFLGIKWAYDFVKKIDHEFMGTFGPEILAFLRG